MSRQRLIAMFDEMVIRKDADATSRHYHPGFVMVSNGISQDYDAFLASHQGVYATDISYAIEYDDDAWVDDGDRVGARLWITTARPGETPTRIEVILLAIYRDDRLFRLWELTWPNWSELPAFEHYSDTA